MRGEKIESSGVVNWPTGDPWKDTGEGGMIVYAVALSENVTRDNFEKCCGVSVANLMMAEAFIGDDLQENLDIIITSEEEQYLEQQFPLEERYWPRFRVRNRMHPGRRLTHYEDFLSVPLLAAVCLGSTNASWFRDDSGYWRCTYTNGLTKEGGEIVAALEKLYARPMRLLTFLDT